MRKKRSDSRPDEADEAVDGKTVAPGDETDDVGAEKTEEAEGAVDSDDPKDLERQNSELKDRWLRTAAELENTRKRAARDRRREVESIRNNVILTFLEILDDLDRAVDHIDGDEEDVRKGVKMIHQKFLRKLTDWGVSPFESLGEDFDPSRMEALAAIPAPGSKPDIVVGVIRRGYTIHEKVLRTAQVSVSAPAPFEKDGDDRNTNGIDDTIDQEA